MYIVYIYIYISIYLYLVFSYESRTDTYNRKRLHNLKKHVWPSTEVCIFEK